MEHILHNSKKYAYSFASNIKVIILSILSSAINFLLFNLKDFLKFLLEKNILQMGIGMIVATQVGKITTAITDYIITPILDKTLFLYGGKFQDIKYTILGIDFQLGEIIIVLLEFILTLMIIYSIWKFSSYTDLNSIEHMLADAKIKIE